MFLSPLATALQTAHQKKNTTVLRSFTQELMPALAILVILVIIDGIAIVTGLDLAFKRCPRFITK